MGAPLDTGFQSIDAEQGSDEFLSMFKEAADFAKSGKLVVQDDNLQLELYGYFKQAMFGPAKTQDEVAFWDYVAKAKWNAWSRLGNMSKLEAMKHYVSLVDRLSPGWRALGSPRSSPVLGNKDDNNNNNNNSGSSHNSNNANVSAKERSWKGTSKMLPESSSDVEDGEDSGDGSEEKGFLYYCREGDVGAVVKILQEQGTSVLSQKDSEGVTGLLWAVDRGHHEMVSLMLQAGANVDQRDDAGMTALHYACMCNDLEMVQLLLQHGADKNIQDNDDISPNAMADDPRIQALLE